MTTRWRSSNQAVARPLRRRNPPRREPVHERYPLVPTASPPPAGCRTGTRSPAAAGHLHADAPSPAVTVSPGPLNAVPQAVGHQLAGQQQRQVSVRVKIAERGGPNARATRTCARRP